jgi:hypothetical protein
LAAGFLGTPVSAYSGDTYWAFAAIQSHTFTPPVTGYYMLRVWGAQGGNNGGLGGYSQGVYRATAGTPLYVYVGGVGKTSTPANGWNGGGGFADNSHYPNSGGGGGATDVRTINNGNTDGLNSRLIVAGGGGGVVDTGVNVTTVGHGGGLEANNALIVNDAMPFYVEIYGASQNSSRGVPVFSEAGKTGCTISYGYFGNGGGSERAGGGGGWWGGTSVCYIGAGGSGYIDKVSDYHGITKRSDVGIRTSNGFAQIMLLPELTGSSPAVGSTAGGNTLTITGNYFSGGRVTGANAVKVGGVNCTSYTVENDGTITCQTPAHAAGTVDVTVTSDVGSTETLSGVYTYYGTPTISNLTPGKGFVAGGETVVINGTNFYTPVTVKFGTVTASCTVDSLTKITCVAPAQAAGSVNITVATDYGSAAAAGYGYEEPFVSLSLDKAAVGLSGSPGGLLADYLTAQVATNLPKGYHLDIQADEPRLKCEKSEDYILPLAGAGVAMADNHWGYGTGATLPSVWTGVTLAPVAVRTTTAPNATGSVDEVALWFGTRVNTALPACKYGGKVVVSVLGNVV